MGNKPQTQAISTVTTHNTFNNLRGHSTAYYLFYNAVRIERQLLVPLMLKDKEFSQVYFDEYDPGYKSERYLLQMFIQRGLKFRLHVIQGEIIIDTLSLKYKENIKNDLLSLSVRNEGSKYYLKTFVLKIYSKIDRSFSASLSINDGPIYNISINLLNTG